MTDAPPPPIPNPPVRPGALPDPRRWLDLDFKAIEERVITVCGIDPASLAGDRTVVLAAMYGAHHFAVILDEGHLVRSDPEATHDGLLTDEFRKALDGLKEAKIKPEAAPEPLYPNRKQRRIKDAKARRRWQTGKRKRMVFDIESYDPNRRKDWLR